MNTRKSTSFVSILCVGGLLLGMTACTPNRPTTTLAPSTTALRDTSTTVRNVRHTNLAADAYFGFGQTQLSPEGKAKLDALVAEIPGKQDPRIQITGYTDRLGNEEHNMQLALRRAEAVRDYLVSQGVEVELIDLNALGPHDPIVTCTGKTGTDLIRCLGPNRRTVVEFSAFEVLDAAPQAPDEME
ncbi:MAG TPA: OmpA family protein [Gammaproteobacteria bacterium]